MRFDTRVSVFQTRVFAHLSLPVLVLNSYAVSALQYCTGNFYGSDTVIAQKAQQVHCVAKGRRRKGIGEKVTNT